MPLSELQIDGLVGPTHHFAGLSPGNLASTTHAGWRSRPRAAARQGLAKMARVIALGVPQAALPPLVRPDLTFLRRCGYDGDDAQVLTAAAREPPLLRWAMSSAAMWTANLGTAAPSVDASDGRARVVVANLIATPHRALEAKQRATQLRAWLRDAPIEVIDALPATPGLGDEGAANHCRFDDGQRVAHLFVHGREAALRADALPQRFPARQSREASAAVTRLLRLDPRRVVHARQHAAAIDAGAFHNDVVMVATGDRLLCHARALVDQPSVLARLRAAVPGLRVREVADDELSLDQAVASYLFNSQLLSTPRGMVLLAPAQVAEGAPARIAKRLVEEGFVAAVEIVELGESMANGGGPACLRLRVPLTSEELARLPAGRLLDAAAIARLEAWVDAHYREELAMEDLADPRLIDEGRTAMAELATILG